MMLTRVHCRFRVLQHHICRTSKPDLFPAAFSHESLRGILSVQESLLSRPEICNCQSEVLLHAEIVFSLWVCFRITTTVRASAQMLVALHIYIYTYIYIYIYTKLNLIPVEFELTYFKAAVKHFSLYAMWTSLSE